MTSVARKNEELIFHCDKWFSNNEEEADSVRELAATKNGKALAKGKQALMPKVEVKSKFKRNSTWTFNDN